MERDLAHEMYKFPLLKGYEEIEALCSLPLRIP